MAKEPLHLDFSDAETQRNRLSEAQAKSIRDLYREASKEVGRWAERAPRVPSDALRKEYLNRLQGEINRELKGIERQLDGTVRNSMTEVVQATVGDAKAFAQNFGLSIEGAYSHVPTDIVRAVASGQLYEGNWTLSKALWLNTVETQRDVQNIVAKGILENRSAYDIAKDLEKYVNPDARKDWDWSKVYPGTRKVIDYNAQRLARTMVSHAYQQAFVRTTQKNPFITKYEWRAADSERTCQLCMDRDGQYFAKDDLPLDHPNGMCTYLAVIEDDFNSIADRLADWANGAEDPALDNWAKDLYGADFTAKKEEAHTDSIKQFSSEMEKLSKTADTWDGGTPIQKDKFEQNAKRLGLTVQKERLEVGIGEDKSYTTRYFVELKDPLLMYHNTSAETAMKILESELRPQSAGGLQVTGVYLTGGKNDLKGWSENQVTLEVLLLPGQRVYKDVQPNAVFVREAIPTSRLKLLD